MEEVRVKAAELRAHAARALDEIRRIARGLRPVTLDELGLPAALERLAIEFAQTSGIAVDVHCSGLDGERLPRSVEIALYRIAQESLTNAGKHAAARTASIVVQRAPNRIILIVEDDGRGFDPSTTPACGGFGLQGIRERVALLGGSVTVESVQGRGTTVFVGLPAVPA
jgi:signal transduction histidine kinase